MQHLLQVSRKIDYALRAMIHLAGLPEGERQPLHEVSTKIGVPRDFLAKIVRVLVDAGLVSALRGPHGGVAIARDPEEISFLEVIETVEGPVQLNVCLDDSPDRHSCVLSASCTMQAVWRAGQERMLDVYRATTIAELVPGNGRAPVALGAKAKDRAPGASTG